MSAYVLIGLFYKRSRIEILYFGSLAVLYIYLVFHNLSNFWYSKFRFNKALAFFPLNNTLGLFLILLFTNLLFIIFKIRCSSFHFWVPSVIPYHLLCNI